MRGDFWRSHAQSNSSSAAFDAAHSTLGGSIATASRNRPKKWYSRDFQVPKQSLDSPQFGSSGQLQLTQLLTKYGIQHRCSTFVVNVPHILFTDDEMLYWPRNMPPNILTLVAVFSENFTLGCISNLKLPVSLRVLILGKNFDAPLPNLPGGTEVIIFPSDGIYSQPLDNLPISLQAIVLNKAYNKSLDLLPANCRIYRPS